MAKPRKQHETDADYIARLEVSIATREEQFKRWKKAWKRLNRVLLPAADRAGLVLQTAAEITNTKDDPQVLACIEGLRTLASCSWNEDDLVVPDLPPLPPPQPEKFGGDAEMILLSALERAKQERKPWEDWTDLVPNLKGTDPASLDWTGIANQVFDALESLEFSRGWLRLDMRSAMYDHCFSQIASALRQAEVRSREDRQEELNYDMQGIPF